MNLLRRGWTAWESFWGVHGTTFALGIFRIGFAYCLWREVHTTRAKSIFSIAGDGFHFPYVDWIRPLDVNLYHTIHDVQYVLIALVAIGLFSRLSCLLLFGLQGYIFFADQLNFRNHPYFFIMLLLLLALAPAHEALSWKSVRRMVRERRVSVDALIGPSAPLTYQRLIQVEVCLAYFIAGLHKINWGFLRGDVLGRQMRQTQDDWGGTLTMLLPDAMAGWIQEMLLSQPSLVAAALATLALELALPFTLWFRRTRVPSMIVGIGFHGSIMVLMNINTFSIAMMASYLLFLENDTLPNLARGIGRRLGRLGRTAPPVGTEDATA